MLALLAACAVRASAADELQARIHAAREIILPKTVYIHVIGRGFTSGEAKRGIWTGSGVILSSDGYVATNHHVLEQAQRVRVLLSDRRSYEAKVIGTDQIADLGLLKLILPPGHPALPSAEWGDSQALTAGDFVLAVGSPLGLTRSVALGIVNNPAQFLEGDGGLYNWIQTDASINPGNSGGPLVDLDGKVVGINTLGGRGIGFAIPSAAARAIIARLKTDGKIERSRLGLTFQARRDFNRDFAAPGEKGVLIVGADPGSAGAGFKPGDLLLSAGGAPTDAEFPDDIPAVNQIIADLKPGRPAAFELVRAGVTMTLTAVPRLRSPEGAEARTLEASDWMLTAREITEEDVFKRYFRPKGCYVLGVASEGNAAKSGLKDEDVVVSVDGAEISSLDDLRGAYERSLARKASDRLILVSVLRRGQPLKIALDYTRSKAAQEEDR